MKDEVTYNYPPPSKPEPPPNVQPPVWDPVGVFLGIVVIIGIIFAGIATLVFWQEERDDQRIQKAMRQFENNIRKYQ